MVNTYEEQITELARLFISGKAGYDNCIISAKTIAERFDRDGSWSGVDFEDAVAKEKMYEFF